MKKISKILCTLCLLVSAWAVSAQNSPYMTRVFDFSPAPGQFIHVYPAVTLGMDSIAVANLCEGQLAGVETGMISLGGYGGYITVGFDHNIQNIAGEKDFQVLGNAFYSSYGSSGEPGIVMVSDDVNGNGLPDDPWYEIAGSAYASCIKNYSITYYKPSAELDAAEGNIDEYVAWKDNQGATGYLGKNSYHKQAYYPCWYGDSCTFSGTIIPLSALSECSYNYCDVVPNNDPQSGIDISDAVNADGTPANLQQIRFVKVYTGIYKVEAPFGETSTEFCGAKDLHPTVGLHTTTSEFALVSNGRDFIQFNAPEEGNGVLFTLAGQRVESFTIVNGLNSLSLNNLASGVYILAMEGQNKNYRLKVIKR